MKLVKALVGLLFGLLIFACKQETSKNFFNLKIADTLSFDVGFEYSRSGFFTRKDKETYFYFADPVTHKKIKFFDKNGNFFLEVSLIDALKKIEEVLCVDVINEDTIVLLGFYNNKIAIINNKGDVWKYHELGNTTIDRDSSFFFIYGTGYKNYTYIDGQLNLIYSLNFAENIADKREGKVPNNELEYIKYSCKRQHNAPVLCRIKNIFSDSVEFSFELNEFNRLVSDSPFVQSRPIMYFPIKDNLFIYSSDFPNKLLHVDKNMKVVNQVNVFSKHTTIGKNPIKINQNKFEAEIEQARMQKVGSISRVFWLPNVEMFVIVVKHKLINEETEDKISLIFFNAEFQLIEEVLLEGKYSPYSYCMEGNNIIFELLKDNLKKHEKKFVVFTIH
ncbi:MAG: hypothetical protein HJHJAOHD_00448 [Flavobacteriales bacterium]|nr:hypothetical protein [Flavobacteriales bacterium]